MLKKILLLVSVLLLTAWLGASWVVSGQFLELGVIDFDPEEHAEILHSTGIAQLAYEQVEIKSGDISLAGTLVTHPQAAPCGIVLLPGIGGTRNQVLPIVEMFYDTRCHLLAYDPRGAGASTRVPRTFGYFEKQDNATVIHWLAEKAAVDVSAIGIWGPSFGAAVGLLTLEDVPELGFVIADSTFSSFDRVAADTISLLSHPFIAGLLTSPVLWMLELRTGMNTAAVAPELAIRTATSPVLLIHAREDPAMALRHSEARPILGQMFNSK